MPDGKYEALLKLLDSGPCSTTQDEEAMLQEAAAAIRELEGRCELLQGTIDDATNALDQRVAERDAAWRRAGKGNPHPKGAYQRCEIIGIVQRTDGPYLRGGMISMVRSLSLHEENMRDAIRQAKKVQSQAGQAVGQILEQHREDGHVYEKRPDSDVARCAVCDDWLGWWCPVLEGPCEYDDESENCKACGEPGERK